MRRGGCYGSCRVVWSAVVVMASLLHAKWWAGGGEGGGLWICDQTGAKGEKTVGRVAAAAAAAAAAAVVLVVAVGGVAVVLVDYGRLLQPEPKGRRAA